MERREFLKRSLGTAALTVAGASLLKAAHINVTGIAIEDASDKTYPTVTSIFKSGGRDIKVHAISTGSISVKKNFMVKKGPGLLSKVNIKFGKEYTPFLPIWVYVIEHPEGTIIIDTGDIEAAAHAPFYEKESSLNKMALNAMGNIRKIRREDELDIQLALLGIKPANVSKVVLTHLHGDHIDGVKFFEGNEIIVHELEQKYPVGYLPTTMPAWFKPTLVNYHKNRVDYFDQGFALTKAEDVLMIPTPGHTKYHSSILFRTDNEHILFAGDMTYQPYQLDKGELSGSHADYRQASASINKTVAYTKEYPTIYLTSHGFEAHEALRNKIIKR